MFYLKEPLINSILYLALMQIILHCSRCFGDERADHNIRPNDAPFYKSGRVFHRRLARNEDGTSDLNIATYNLWNIMFHWEVRKMHIADMIETHDIDVIGFQEVRADKSNSHNQLQELQELLPKHTSMIFHPTRIDKKNPEHRPPGWELEGIGLLSKHKILSYHVRNLTLQSDVDTIQRAVLSALLLINGHEVTVIVVHFSYDQDEQCNNVWDLLKYLHVSRPEKMILLGDFNTYNDYSWPMDLLLTGSIDSKAPVVCQRTQKPWFHGHPDYEFVDAWIEVDSKNPGFTFSNMPVPGLHSRPDRILLSQTDFNVDMVFNLGSGQDYKRDYTKQLHLARLQTIYQSAKRQLEGQLYESACLWDCGPHGVCRCGICVQKREDDCSESFCSSCGPARLRYYQFLQMTFFVALSLLLFSLGVCISRPICISLKSAFCSKLQRSVFTRKSFIFLTAITMIAVYLFFKWNYSDVLELVDSQIPEEFYPSDHLMVVARVTIEK